MDKNVNVEVYEFLNRHQCEIIKSQGKLIFFVRIPFDELMEFVEIIGRRHFEKSIDVQMFDDHIVFELNDIFDYSGMFFYDYKKCFENYQEFEVEVREREG